MVSSPARPEAVYSAKSTVGATPSRVTAVPAASARREHEPQKLGDHPDSRGSHQRAGGAADQLVAVTAGVQCRDDGQPTVTTAATSAIALISAAPSDAAGIRQRPRRDTRRRG